MDFVLNTEFFGFGKELYFLTSSFDELFNFQFFFQEFCHIYGVNLQLRKSKVFSVFTGFNFMGWKFILLNNKSFFNFIRIDEIRKHKRILKATLLYSTRFDVSVVLRNINSLIFDWLSRYNLSDYPWDICSELDLYLYKLLWRFVRKRHSRKSKIWIYSKYWTFLSGKWRFFVVDSFTGNVSFLRSYRFNSSKIFRLPSSVNFFDLADNVIYRTFWFEHSASHFLGIYKILFINQCGLCSFCRKSFNTVSLSQIKVCKLVYLSSFNSNKVLQLVLLHNYCCV